MSDVRSLIATDATPRDALVARNAMLVLMIEDVKAELARVRKYDLKCMKTLAMRHELLDIKDKELKQYDYNDERIKNLNLAIETKQKELTQIEAAIVNKQACLKRNILERFAKYDYRANKVLNEYAGKINYLIDRPEYIRLTRELMNTRDAYRNDIDSIVDATHEVFYETISCDL